MQNNMPWQNKAVQEKFSAYPSDIKDKLLRIRQLIFETATKIKEIGEIEETLKWNEPSYAPKRRGIGTAVRIDWKKNDPERYAIYFHCQTTLVETFRELYGKRLTYSGNRAILFNKNDKPPYDALSNCIAMALTYHWRKNDRPLHAHPRADDVVA